jgi:hypothetical protein
MRFGLYPIVGDLGRQNSLTADINVGPATGPDGRVLIAVVDEARCEL